MGIDETPDDGALIRVWLVAPPPELDLRSIRLATAQANEAAGFDVTTTPHDRGLWAQLASHRPHVIVSFGPTDQHPELLGAPLQVRRRWIDGSGVDPPSLARRILDTFLANASGNRFPERPLVSVITPTYRTGPRLLETYRSVLAQTYDDWEWVVLDDSDDGGATFAALQDLAAEDPRVRAHRGTGRDGSIGSVKRRATTSSSATGSTTGTRRSRSYPPVRCSATWSRSRRRSRDPRFSARGCGWCRCPRSWTRGPGPAAGTSAAGGRRRRRRGCR